MAKQKKSTPQPRQEMTALERLGLRVSSMINHPIAQAQRWVTIHRLDTDGDMEWEEVMGLLAERGAFLAAGIYSLPTHPAWMESQ